MFWRGSCRGLGEEVALQPLLPASQTVSSWWLLDQTKFVVDFHGLTKKK